MNKMKNIKPNKNGQFDQGYYKPINEHKYASSDKKIIYRSSLELKFCQMCDTSRKIIKWVSEPIAIKYIHPFEKDTLGKPKICNYYPDYFVEIKVGEFTKKYLIEVKPYNLVVKPKPLPFNATRKQKENYLYKLKTISINQAKRRFAQDFCKKKGWEYMFVTENFINKLK